MSSEERGELSTEGNEGDEDTCRKGGSKEILEK